MIEPHGLPCTIGSPVSDHVDSRWNNGTLHALLGPVGIAALAGRAILSSLYALASPRTNTLIGVAFATRNTLPDPSTQALKMVARKVVHKLFLLMASVLGTAAWGIVGFLGYGLVVLLSQGAPALLTLIKGAITATLALAAAPAFPWILGGIILACALLAIARFHLCRQARKYIEDLLIPASLPPQGHVPRKPIKSEPSNG
jgi:uncharacterized membrane protein YuzA (DUF378 family)